MRMIMKFKDGQSCTQKYTDEEFKVVTEANLLKSMAIGKLNDSTITATDTKTGTELIKKYSDLYSMEFVFDD